jgi:tellurite resistance protein TerB
VFKMLKSFVADKLSRYSGQTDFLEAVCAASALVANADGNVSDDEVDGIVKTIAANAALSAGFTSRQIEQTAEAMIKRAQGGRMGRSGLMRELEDVAKDADKAEAVAIAALDVAEADGSIGAEEQAVLLKIGAALGIDMKRLMDS